MAPSTALTTKVESGSPYQLDNSQVLRASKSLLKHVKEQKDESKKPNLLEADSSEDEAVNDDHPIWLVATTKKHIVDKKRLKPGKVVLPHSLNQNPESKICLITVDPQRTYKDLIEDPAFPKSLSSRIGRVIGITKLKAKYKSFESRRQLASEYDIFLADERIVTYLPQVLGKAFYKGGSKRPVPVSLTGNEKSPKDKNAHKVIGMPNGKPKRDGNDKSAKLVGKPKDVAKAIERAIGSALIHLSPSVTTAIKIASARFTPQQVVENVETVVNVLTEKFIPKGWRNVRALHIKGPNTTALPIWLASELWVDEEDVLDEPKAVKAPKEVKVIEAAKKNKKRKSMDAEDVPVKGEKPAKKSKKEAEGADLAKEIALRKEKLKKQKAAALADVDSDIKIESMSERKKGSKVRKSKVAITA